MVKSFLLSILFVLFWVGGICQRITEVSIGNQIWMSENLNVDKFQNGDKIPEAKTEAEWSAYALAGEAAWCYYKNDKKNGEKFGKIYNWYAVNDSRGLAPAGWHIPTDEDWLSLEQYVGGESNGGVKLKSKEGWQNNGNGTNSCGFNGCPGGSRHSEGAFSFIYENGDWWSASILGSSAHVRHLAFDNGSFYSDFMPCGFGCSVRCIKN